MKMAAYRQRIEKLEFRHESRDDGKGSFSSNDKSFQAKQSNFVVQICATERLNFKDTGRALTKTQGEELYVYKSGPYYNCKEGLTQDPQQCWK